RLGYGLIMNHPFVDGNKRIGAHAMLVFLALNGIELDYTQDELSDMILGVAAGGSGFEQLLKWIIGHQQ
ncbi:MAG: type II toxin-antitoxin system death-on-curing family toxin, partial [Clostridia bacterium]|nr:type II toxin-antitoxin system death-on-curing family toxin [Clostridia bacterium]